MAEIRFRIVSAKLFSLDLLRENGYCRPLQVMQLDQASITQDRWPKYVAYSLYDRNGIKCASNLSFSILRYDRVQLLVCGGASPAYLRSMSGCGGE